MDLRNIPDSVIWEAGINLDYLIDAYTYFRNNRPAGLERSASKKDTAFFRPFFQNLMGVDYVSKMILENKTAEEIRAVWQPDVEKFKKQRQLYLLYEE